MMLIVITMSISMLQVRVSTFVTFVQCMTLVHFETACVTLLLALCDKCKKNENIVFIVFEITMQLNKTMEVIKT